MTVCVLLTGVSEPLDACLVSFRGLDVTIVVFAREVDDTVRTVAGRGKARLIVSESPLALAVSAWLAEERPDWCLLVGADETLLDGQQALRRIAMTKPATPILGVVAVTDRAGTTRVLPRLTGFGANAVELCGPVWQWIPMGDARPEGLALVAPSVTLMRVGDWQGSPDEVSASDGSRRLMQRGLVYAPANLALLFRLAEAHVQVGNHRSATRLYRAVLAQLTLESNAAMRVPLVEITDRLRVEADADRGSVGPTAHVSLCMIVRNEAKRLARCLASVETLADEIIVVDTGSTDATPAIAGSFGATVVHRAWTDDFAAARNAGLALATGDWVLVLDADEELDQECLPALRAAVAAVPDRPTVFSLDFWPTGDDGRPMGNTYLSARLFGPAADFRFQGRIHEQLAAVNVDTVAVDRVLTAVRVWHQGYAPSEVLAKGKLQRNHDLLLRASHEEPANPFHAFNLAKTLDAMGDRAAEAQWERCWQLCRAAGHTPPYLARVVIHRIRQALLRRDGVTALARAAEAIAACPLEPAVWQQAGTASLLCGLPEEAVQRLLQATTLQEPQWAVETYPEWRWKAYAGLAQGFLALNRLDEADMHLKGAMALNPQSADLLALKRALDAARGE